MDEKQNVLDLFNEYLFIYPAFASVRRRNSVSTKKRPKCMCYNIQLNFVPVPKCIPVPNAIEVNSKSQNEMAQLSASIDAISKINEALTGRVGELEKSIDRLVKLLDDSQKGGSVCADKIYASQKIIATSSSSENHENNSNENGNLSRKIDGIEKNMDRLVAELDIRKSDHDGLSKDVRKLQEHIEHVPESLRNLNDDNERLTDTINNMNKRLKSLPGQIGKICNANEHGGYKMEDTEKMQEIKSEIIGMRNKNDIIAAKVADLQKDISGLPSKFGRLCSIKAGNDEKIDDIHSRVASLPNDLEEICSEGLRNISLINKTFKNTKNIISKLEELQDENTDLQTDLSKLQTSVTNMANEVENVRKLHENQTDTVNQMFSNSMSICGEENTASDPSCDCREDYANLTSKLDKMILNATRIPNEVITLLQNNAELANEISILRKEITRFPNATNTLLTGIGLLRHKLSKAQCKSTGIINFRSNIP